MAVELLSQVFEEGFLKYEDSPLFELAGKEISYKTFHDDVMSMGSHIHERINYRITCKSQYYYAVMFFAIIIYKGVAVLEIEENPNPITGDCISDNDVEF